MVEHWDPEGDVVRALLTWLAACDAWEVRTGVPVWPAWEGPGRAFGPRPAAQVPGVEPPPPGVVSEAQQLRASRRGRTTPDPG
ncbi:hypothetical protein GCM10009602_43910 [Nocardiopsis tropica]